MEDKREPQCIPGGGLLEPSPGICYLLPVSLSSPPLLVGRGCEVAASCFAHLEDQLWFFTHIFLQLRVSGRDVLMITGQAAASPQLPLVLTSRGCSRALEGHLCEADAAKAAWEEATVPCRSNSCLSVSLLQPLRWDMCGVEEGRSLPHMLSSSLQSDVAVQHLLSPYTSPVASSAGDKDCGGGTGEGGTGAQKPQHM